MTEIAVHLPNYGTGGRGPAVLVDQYEGGVHLDLRQIDDGTGPSLTPEEARALAAVLLAQAEEASR